MTKTIYHTTWHLGTIDGGRSTSELELALNDVRYAMENGFTLVTVKIVEVDSDSEEVA